ncbi:MAG TPA: dihydrofolate reductase [Saprospiraceae bacterium]|nr:MAG: dihydrofolate reductase [Candidatus Parvibacillus calidus]MCC7149213.1 dihydrofolate reductase [Saprospiraceae bacterium]MBK7741247.1 dihydrofolate reductase [Candidatus Parvibacillus calidus]MCO5282340.1 dihydrofolate reductase [Saprospiraceae bacterium]MCO6469852.1 dihydrofolate reductase [Saprospiraceae bacterium]
MIVSAIVAVAENGVIGDRGAMSWHLKSDFKYFKKKTLHHPIIMGRTTFESIGRPLPKRENIIITRDMFYLASGALIAHSVEEAMDLAARTGNEEVFIIGGAEIFRQTIGLWDKLYYTEVHMVARGDTFFPMINWDEWVLTERIYQPKEENDDSDCTFKVFLRSGRFDSHGISDY